MNWFSITPGEDGNIIYAMSGLAELRASGGIYESLPALARGSRIF